MAYSGEQKRQYQREWLAKRRDAWIKSRGGACENCGSQERLEVDHIDRTIKEINASWLWSRSQSVRDKELEKCQVLCFDCHQSKTIAEMTVDAPHGTTTRYDKGCRCQDCRDVKAEGMRRSRANRKNNAGE